MKRFQTLIIIFYLALSIPLAYFILRTYRSLEQEEIARLRYFGQTLFDEMENELAGLIRKEESRPVDAYNYFYSPSHISGKIPGTISGTISGKKVRSPLSFPPALPYITGYIQNNPDGSFQSPLVPENKKHLPEFARVLSKLERINTIFNKKRSLSLKIFEIRPVLPFPRQEKKPAPTLADKYLKSAKSKRKKVYLGKKEKKRVEKITPAQALNLAKREDIISQNKIKTDNYRQAYAPGADKSPNDEMSMASKWQKPRQSNILTTAQAPGKYEIKAEIDPMQPVFIDSETIFIFRRIVINNKIFRQGFIIDIKKFLNYLVETHFSTQPMSFFTRLDLEVKNGNIKMAKVSAGASAGSPGLFLARIFPRPFSFLKAEIRCENFPQSAGRKTLNIMIAILAGVIFLGFFTILKSAKAIVELSERRAKFVSSVTHELKTPLTNIRMYIEMLEQGIAQNPETEDRYFRILKSESARLARLINNILEFSRLEKKEIRFNWQKGNLEDVIASVKEILKDNLEREGFLLEIDHKNIEEIMYDRELMVQVLINLVENSMKFGKDSHEKKIKISVNQDGKYVNISVSDKGPGIPRHALKKVFDDFYRVESPLIRKTRGTGIGLAFVKKVITAMGGKVFASNNDAGGCTITLSMPVNRQ